MPAHPEDELLADLAADVLPIDVARQVEAHVMTCARCFEVLSDAASIPELLRQASPEAMPPQVLASLDQALTAARLGHQPQPMPRRAAGVESTGTGPVRRNARTGAQGQQPLQPGQRPRQPMPGQPGQPAQGQRPPAQPAPGQRPQQPAPGQPGQQPAPSQPGQQPVRPAARQGQGQAGPNPVQGGAQPAPNTSSYRVRPLKRQESEAAYPADDPTALHPAVRADGPDPDLTQPVRKRRNRTAAEDPTAVHPAVRADSADPDLTQPVRKRRNNRAVAPAAPETSGMTQQMRPVRDKGPSKLTRMDSTQAIRVRRQALEEQKADEPSRWPRISPQIAAAVVLVLGLAAGAITWQVRSGGGNAEMTGGAASASAPLLTTVQESGTEYQKADLAGQVDALVQRETEPETTRSSEKSGAADSGDNRTLSAQEEANPQADAAGDGEGVPNRELLKDPEALQACLRAIDREDAVPVAVDLATYDGREAALIVLPGTSGGYDVWIVARTCQPGADGTVDVVEVNS